MPAGGPARPALPPPLTVPPAYHQLPDRVLAATAELRAEVAGILQRAERAGVVRESVTVDEVYLLVRALAQASATMPTSPRTLERAIGTVLAGILVPD